ncbi:tRNA dimethylallyltransferase [hydrothermal vent metagenome]|uniref:tRNA dimethylallyltransferase n=1 Tax=hydrothermal vent metagenome TaxID=652676 RepID=A0A3B0ZY74_9ZZZZ
MSKPEKPPIVCIMGPTASGKTDLAITLSKKYPMDIISVDSAMVYKGMDIGTAKPDAQTLAHAPHRLVDFLDPAEAYSAAQFCADALREMQQITEQGRIPLLVGGTMLYFKALLYGLSDMPSADEATREKLVAETQTLGLAAMHARLAEVDPESAARIHPNDPQRIQRALEVYELTGISLTAWQAKPVDPLPYEPIQIALVPSDRSWLHRRIELRFKMMLKQGLVEEVKTLFQRKDLDENKPAIRAVGYRQVWQHLAGQLDYDDMQERGIIATRQLAKRQLTWLRSMPDLKNFDCINSNLEDEVLNFLERGHITE